MRALDAVTKVIRRKLAPAQHGSVLLHPSPAATPPAALQPQPQPQPDSVAAPHFVKDYESFVNMLLANFPESEAMSHAVGGAYEETGLKERAILEYAGLRAGMSLVDIGCGSGRLATSLGDVKINYLGTDVVQKLLDYARSKAPAQFRFLRHTELTVPVPSGAVDMICAFKRVHPPAAH